MRSQFEDVLLFMSALLMLQFLYLLSWISKLGAIKLPVFSELILIVSTFQRRQKK